MKKKYLLLTLTLVFLSYSCGIIKNVEDITANAAELLENIAEISSEIDARVESGELSQEVADLIDERIEHLSEVLNSTIEQSGGFLFDQVNGSVDNIFDNIQDLLDQIKEGILDDSLPNLITQLSDEIETQINLLSASLEDIIVLAFGNTFVLVDKVTNSVVTIASILFLVIGLIIFSLVLIKRTGKFKGVGPVIGLSFMLIYVLFFLGVLLVPAVRCLVIVGFDFGKQVQGVQVEPKITGVGPQTFVLGKSKHIQIYGKHLDKVNEDSLRITLNQGSQEKLAIPRENLIVVSSHKIVLGNFKEGGLKWVLPRFRDYQVQFRQRNTQNVAINFQNYGYKINDKIYPRKLNLQQPTLPVNPTVANPTLNRVTNFTRRPRFNEMDVFVTELAPTGSSDPSNIIKAIFQNTFQLPEGDFGLHVFDGTSRLSSPQFFSILYPPPPVPKPDLYPVDVNFTGGTPVAGQTTSLTLKTGIAYPEEVDRSFKVRITSSPAMTPIVVDVREGDIAAAGSNNIATVRTRNFKVANSGQYTFNLAIDQNNRISESNEGNNTFSKRLPVKRFVYDADVTFSTFESEVDHDSWPNGADEYRIDIITTVTGHNKWKIDYNKDGEPNNAYSINQSRSFDNLKEGDKITIFTTGYESDGGLTFDNDGMGSKSATFTINGNQNQNRTINLKPRDYSIKGSITISRRAVF